MAPQDVSTPLPLSPRRSGGGNRIAPETAASCCIIPSGMLPWACINPYSVTYLAQDQAPRPMSTTVAAHPELLAHLHCITVGRYHAVSVRSIDAHFVTRLASNYLCSQQQPNTIAGGPEPDYVIARRRALNYLDHHPYPEDIHLVIEVAEATLARDRGAKLDIYARAGIPEYWILNLIDRQLEIFTEPDTQAGTYARQGVLQERETLEDHPLAGTVALAQWLP